MKTFDELTDEEVLALTDEQVERYIDLACAEEGVPLFVAAPEPPAPSAAAVGDVTLYKVADVLFVNRDDAETVAGLISSAPRMDSHFVGTDYSMRVVRPFDREEEVGTVKFFSDARWAAVRDQVQKDKAAKEEFDKQSKAHQAAVRARREAAEPIRERIERVWEEHRERERIGRVFDQYLKLADGDRAVALRFLQKVEQRSAETRPDLFAGSEVEMVF